MVTSTEEEEELLVPATLLIKFGFPNVIEQIRLLIRTYSL